MEVTIGIVEGASKEEKYQALVKSIDSVISGESDFIANLANIASMLKYELGFFWVGFYLVKEGELVLGPFQGPIACTRIKKGKGVCGESWESGKSIVVPDVDAFAGHIACNSASRSEIVIPLRRDNEVIGVLDVDSDQVDDFDAVDQRYLEEIVHLI